jgi:DNA-binding SARP family transcriptional activator
MIENRAFEKARDVCYFLVTIAPGVSQFWVCIGQCDANLRAYDVALQELTRAIEVDPTNATAYSEIVHLLIETHEYSKAIDLCHAGLEFAEEHPDEPWAAVLRQVLEEKINDVHIAQHSQHHAT